MIQLTSNLRCGECRYEAPGIEFFLRGRKCPRCDSPFQLDPDNDLIIVGHAQTQGQQGGVWIRLGWQEFRMLAIWSRFWADYQAQLNPEKSGWMLRIIDSISHQLKKAAPSWPLTMADDAAELKRRSSPGQEVVGTRPDGSEIQFEPTWLNSETTRHEPPAPPHEKGDT
jgi:hypothetical protein